MSPVFTVACVLCVAYLLGSLSGSLLLGRLRGVDVRTMGSGNAGGTNAFRTQGLRFALGVVLIDVGKGALAAWLALRFAPEWAWPAAGLAVLGHVWPVWHGFRGGKGAATAVGALLVLWPLAVPLMLGVWLLVLVTTGYVGLSTVLATASLPLWAWLFHAGAAAAGVFRRAGAVPRLHPSRQPAAAAPGHRVAFRARAPAAPAGCARMNDARGERALLQRLAAGPVSGDVLAGEAGLTRAAVWKRIEALRDAGIAVEAAPGRGYRLAQPLDLLEADAIRAALPASARTALAALEVAWSLDSTNSELLRRDSPVHGCAVLLAERQTGGRGRRGREWMSPLAAHLYLSLARRFEGGLARLGGLSLVAGVAACEALQALGFPQARLKWPNDLVVEAGSGLRKLGGLLVEGGGEAGGAARAVIGIGVNVRMPATFASGIDQPWTQLAALAPSPPARNLLAAALLEHLLPALDVFDAQGLAPFLPRYAALDALAGKPVQVHEPARCWDAQALGIADDGALRVRDDTGDVRLVHAGDVSVRATRAKAGPA